MASTRRDFLKIAAMVSGGAGFLPGSIQRAFAIDPEPGSTYADADHIVILMQENRSFDHTFGTLQGVRGFNDPRALRLANGNSVFVQTDAAGHSYAPWRLDIKDTKITWMGSLPHSRQSQVDAWNNGQHDGWLEAKRSHDHQYAALPTTMGHYTREDLPFYYALADAFTICDQSYCGAMTSTTPNRSLFWTGTVRDRQTTDSNVFMRNGQYRVGQMSWTTFPERLQQVGISWKIYQNQLSSVAPMTKEENAWLSNFEDNPLEYFAAYSLEANARSVAFLQQQLATAQENIPKIEHALAAAGNDPAAAKLRIDLATARRYIDTLNKMLAASAEEHYRRLTPQQRELHDLAFSTNRGDPDSMALEPLAFEDDGQPLTMHVPRGDILYQFRKDVHDGRLPTVSWLVPPEKFSDHPSSPWYGAWYVSEVMDILTKNPEVWKKTIFILTYDENDGYFDHAPSFVAADTKRPETGGASPGIDTGLEYTYAEDELRFGTSAHEARTGPIGLGYRIPTIVASPWSRGGWVNSQVFDHTSTLMFLEDFVQKKFGKRVREDNISAWRRTVAGDLTSCFRPFDATAPALQALDRDRFVISIEKARDKKLPSNYTRLTNDQIADINRNGTLSPFLTNQEPGTRPSCALPYNLHAEGSVNKARTDFRLTLKAGNEAHGQRSAGAPFNVYLRNLKGRPSMRAATYAVTPGDTLVAEFPLALFPDGSWDIEVHGPNGFYRAFVGGRDSHMPDVTLIPERSVNRLTGNMQLQLRNRLTHHLQISIQDHAYGAAAQTIALAPAQETMLTLPLESSHGWYDFSVVTKTSSGSARFAGRIETGRPSVTDPAMAGLTPHLKIRSI
jgi:phospholipase C